jgi:hypothetical protein
MDGGLAFLDVRVGTDTRGVSDEQKQANV